MTFWQRVGHALRVVIDGPATTRINDQLRLAEPPPITRMALTDAERAAFGCDCRTHPISGGHDETDR